jgi:hypothetical protein
MKTQPVTQAIISDKSDQKPCAASKLGVPCSARTIQGRLVVKTGIKAGPKITDRL